jgi:hypothetical protein
VSETVNPKANATKTLTNADAAKAVKRPVLGTNKAGEVEVTLVAVKAAEVLTFKDYGTHLVVVTTDGQKLSSEAVEA